MSSGSAACDSLNASHRLCSDVIHGLCLRVENALRVCEELLLSHRGSVWVQDGVTCKCYAKDSHKDEPYAQRRFERSPWFAWFAR